MRTGGDAPVGGRRLRIASDVELLKFTASIGGIAFTCIVLVQMARFYGWPSLDAYLWHEVGADVWAGVSPYAVHGPGGFFYAPPWAAAFAFLVWVPVPALVGLIFAAEVASLVYLAGSWRRAGYLCWLPMVPLELVGSQWNLVMAAAILAAVRGSPSLAVAVAAAKLSPALSVRPSRRVAAVALGLVAITVPWLWLWSLWIEQLTATVGVDIAPGAVVPIPWVPRLVVAGVLFAVQRPWSRVLAAIVATPVLYWVSTVLLLALIRVPRGRARMPAEHA